MYSNTLHDFQLILTIGMVKFNETAFLATTSYCFAEYVILLQRNSGMS